MDTTSLEEKREQLLLYKQQLVIVNQALDQHQPGDEEHTKLLDARNDLSDVIGLLEEVCAFDDTSAPAVASAASAPSMPEQSIKPALRGKSDLVGRTVEVCLNKQWFNAEVYSVRRDERNVERVMITIFGHKERKEVKLSEIRKLLPVHPAQCMPGTKCQAIYTQDGLWYDCTIDEQTENGYIVTYEIGGKDEIKYDQVRLKSAKTPAAVANVPPTSAQAGKKRPIKEITTQGGYRIPENIIIKPEDTDEVRESKKRKINHLKKLQKSEREDIQAGVKQNSWAKFNTQKRNGRGFLKAGNQKESIFASTSSGKIGVMGSGAGMTVNPILQKHKH